MLEDEDLIATAMAMDDGELSIEEYRSIRVSRTRSGTGTACDPRSHGSAGWPPTLLPPPSYC